MNVLSYKQFLNEKDADVSTSDVSTKEPVTKVDTSKGTTKAFTVNGKEYEGVLTTYQALKSKQESMGYEAVGMLSVPGEKEVYELLIKNENENE